jgi:hypothetical protein
MTTPNSSLVKGLQFNLSFSSFFQIRPIFSSVRYPTSHCVDFLGCRSTTAHNRTSPASLCRYAQENMKVRLRWRGQYQPEGLSDSFGPQK